MSSRKKKQNKGKINKKEKKQKKKQNNKNYAYLFRRSNTTLFKTNICKDLERMKLNQGQYNKLGRKPRLAY